MPSPVTNSVAEMMTASGGHGNLKIRSAVSLPIALTLNKVQDIRTPDDAQTASVDSESKHSSFCQSYFVIISATSSRCPARECHKQKKCDGFLVDSKKIAHLEECINYCKESVGCEWYTYDKKDDHCVMYEDCDTSTSCDTCATGKKYCSKGYHGM